MGASHVWTLHYACRFGKENPTGVEYITAYASFAHADYTETILPNAKAMLMKRGISEEEAKGLDVAFVNTWQPVGRMAVMQHPLAMLDWTTVAEGDMKTESLGYAVTPKGGEEGGTFDAPKRTQAPPINRIYHSDSHHWYFFPSMLPSEMLIFSQCDSRQDHARHCFHTAFWDPTAPPDAPRRQSIELHTLCAFPKKGEKRNQQPSSKM